MPAAKGTCRNKAMNQTAMACYLKLHSRGSPLVVADPKSSPNALNQSGSPGMSCVMTGKVAFYYDKHSVVHVNFALFFIRHLCIGQKIHHCLIPVVPHTAVAEVSTRRRMARERRRACYSVVSSIKDIVGESFIEDDADDQQKGDKNAMSAMTDSKQK